MARTDVSYARRFFANRPDGGSIIGTPGADLIWAGGELVDSWPATPDQNDYAQVRDSKVETLLIGGNLDFATPPQWATRDLLPHLRTATRSSSTTSATAETSGRTSELPASGW